MRTKTIGYSVLGVVLLGGFIGGLAYYGGYRGNPRDLCVNHTGGGSHMHADLEISIDGMKREIPTNVGVGGTCMRPLHTHDSSGKIHIEFPTKHDFSLGDFFTLWSQPFDETHLLDKIADDRYGVFLTVDGQPSQEFRNLILRDGQKIKLEYRQK